jgi:hypothetical protein
MADFLDRYQVQKLNQDQINNLSSPIFPKEMEAVINLQTNKQNKKQKQNKQKTPQDQMGLVQSSVRLSKKS